MRTHEPLVGLNASNNNELVYLAFGLVVFAIIAPGLVYVLKSLFPFTWRRKPN